MTYQTLFCNDGGGGARALAQLDRVVSRCRQRDRGRKDVGYLVDAHSTRQRHFTAFVYIVYSGRHTLRCLKCGGNRGNSVQRYLIFISSNGRRQLMDIDLHDQTILIFSFLWQNKKNKMGNSIVGDIVIQASKCSYRLWCSKQKCKPTRSYTGK
jgi:hypothetical protein